MEISFCFQNIYTRNKVYDQRKDIAEKMEKIFWRDTLGIILKLMNFKKLFFQKIKKLLKIKQNYKCSWYK